MRDYGRQTEFRTGVALSLGRAIGGFEGEVGARNGISGSARRRNCSGVRGEPLLDDGDDFMDLGLCRDGVDMEKEGK